MGSWAADLYSNDWALDFVDHLLTESDLSLARTQVPVLRSEYDFARSYAKLLVIADVFATVGGAPSDEMDDELRVWCDSVRDAVNVQDLDLAEEFVNEILTEPVVRELRGDPAYWHPYVIPLLSRLASARSML